MAIKATALITLTRVNDGKGIKSTSVTYQIWSNGTSTPTGTWSSTPPKTTADKPYLWTRTVITYSDNTQSTSYSVGSTPEGIVVGGRNYALKTRQAVALKGNNTSNQCLNVYVLSVDWKVFIGQYVTISFDYQFSEDAKAPDNASNVGAIGMSVSPWNRFAMIPSPSKSLKGYVVGSCVIPDTMTSSFNIAVRFDYFVGTVTISNFKFETGNKATDWTPAPEDVDEAINTERTERQSAIETKANEITSKVSETYVSNSAFEHYQNTVSTQFTQTKKDFTWSINQSVTDAKNEMSGQIDSVNGRLDGLKQTTDNVNSYMSFDNDALTLGKSDSAFKTKITNQEWSIQKNGAKVTYINDQTMFITDGQFTQSLKVGAFGFVPRANGSLDFKKVG